MSIHKGDFSAAQRADIEALADRLMIPFSAAVRMLVDRGLTRPLTGETIEGALAVSSPDLGVSAEIKEINPEEMGTGEEGPVVNDQPTDPDLVEALRASLLGQKPKRAKRQAVPIPDPPPSIDSPELRAFLPEFAAYRKALGSGKGLKTTGQWDYLFRHLAACAGRQHAVLGLKYAMAKGWMCLEAEYLNGKSWATIASELGLSLEAEKPALSPVDLAARDLKRVVLAAEKKIRDVIAPASDGWLTSTRTLFFDHLDACKSEAEVEAHLAACRALCDRLRVMGAFPLRRPTQPGEILPAGSGGPLAVDLRGAFICDSTCPACGEDQAQGPCFCEGQNDPVVGGPIPVFFPRPICGHACPVCERDFLADKEFEGRPAMTPELAATGPAAGGPARVSFPRPKTERSLTDRLVEIMGGDVPVRFGLRQQGHMPTIEQMLTEGKTWDEIGDAIGWHGPTAKEWYGVESRIIDDRADDQGGLSSAELAAIDPPNPDFFNALSKLPPPDVSGFGDDHLDDGSTTESHPYRYGLGDMGCAICGKKKDAPAHRPVASNPYELAFGVGIRQSDKQRAKVADGQYAFEGHYTQSVYCIHCGMPRDHVRHYLPQELPFKERDGEDERPERNRRNDCVLSPQKDPRP